MLPPVAAHATEAIVANRKNRQQGAASRDVFRARFADPNKNLLSLKNIETSLISLTSQLVDRRDIAAMESSAPGQLWTGISTPRVAEEVEN
jgi:hypothetical protein